MHNLVEMKDGSVRLDANGTLYSFNGTPYERPTNADSLPIVGQAPSMGEWQRDPGHYGPHFAVAQVLTHDQRTFFFGGSWLYITGWVKDYGATLTPNQAIFTSRNKARQVAESLDGVAC